MYNIMGKYINLFHSKSFSKFFIGINFTNFSQFLVNITIAWMIYEKTNQPFLIAIYGVLTQVPSVLFGALCGYIIDKFGSFKVISVGVFIKSIIFMTLFLLPLTDNFGNILSIIILLIINSAITPIISLCTSIIPNQLFNDNQLISANSIINIFFDVAFIAGSIITGIVSSNANEKNAFLIASLLFLFSSFLFIKSQINTGFDNTNFNKNKKAKTSIKQGLVFLITNKTVFYLFIATFLWNLLVWGMLPIVIPVFSKQVLSGGAYLFGWLNSAISIGIIIGSIIVGTLSTKWSTPRSIYYFIIFQGIFLIIFGLQSKSIVSISILILSGIFSAPVMIYKSTILQRMIPENMQGQVFSIIGTMVSITYPLGGFIVGFIADLIPQNKIGGTIVISATIMIIVTAFFLLLDRKENTKPVLNGSK
ncbi:MFS transporter [Lactococcus insecticola]|uniref:MFS transporter n=1 Tax=Pseudolactococcus insecticola TaxID=2709158 RepID=A0A6A0B8A6_9LACT|nr:MFS transporter [Lactococcus insecticola]GFH40624.1 MFS transporter [Lactococcus insecticola]